MPHCMIQPSGDTGATALVIAYDLFAYAELDEQGNLPKTRKEKETCAREQLRLIAEAAKQLQAAVGNGNH